MQEIKHRREKRYTVEAVENNDFFTPTPERSPKFDKRSPSSVKNSSTAPTYSVFRRAKKIKPKDNIGLDFFHEQ